MTDSKYPWNDPDLPDDQRIQKRKDKVLELTLKGYKRNKIAKEMKISISLLWQIRNELVAEGRLMKNTSGMIQGSVPEKKVQAYQELLNSEFGQIESVKKMILGLQKKRKNIDSVVGYFYKVCKTVNRHPDDFLGSEQSVNMIKDEFIEKFQRGDAYYIDKNNARKFLNAEHTSPENYLASMRAFRSNNGIPMSRGFLMIPNKQSGRYAKIKLSDSQWIEGIKFMGEISELMKNMFIIQTEIGVRVGTLVGLKANFERRTIDVDGIPCEFFVYEIFEVKQEDARSGGNFTKVIITPQGRNLVRDMKQGESLFKTDMSERDLKEAYSNNLRKFYVSIGKIDKNALLPDNNPNHTKYRKGTDEYYYDLMPTHTVRHSCIHWLLRCTSNDASTVGSMFWDGKRMLEDFYARQSPIEGLLSEGMCDYCTPQTYPDPNWKRFCRFTHAVAWYNHGKTQKEIKDSRPTSL